MLVLLAKVAFCLVVGMNAEVFIVSLILTQVSDKGTGVLLGSLIFGAPGVAPFVALLALPAARKCPGILFPQVTTALGLAPFPLMILADKIADYLGL